MEAPFNTSKVRLEDVPKSIDPPKLIPFQYLEGAIRSELLIYVLVDRLAFQYLEGAIRRECHVGHPGRQGELSIPRRCD